jgi:hypothetical protein
MLVRLPNEPLERQTFALRRDLLNRRRADCPLRLAAIEIRHAGDFLRIRSYDGQGNIRSGDTQGMRPRDSSLQLETVAI